MLQRVAIQARTVHEQDMAAKAAALGAAPPASAATGAAASAGGAAASGAISGKCGCGGAACGGTNACGGTGRCSGRPRPAEQVAALAAAAPLEGKVLELSTEDFWFATQARHAGHHVCRKPGREGHRSVPASRHPAVSAGLCCLLDSAALPRRLTTSVLHPLVSPLPSCPAGEGSPQDQSARLLSRCQGGAAQRRLARGPEQARDALRLCSPAGAALLRASGAGHGSERQGGGIQRPQLEAGAGMSSWTKTLQCQRC